MKNYSVTEDFVTSELIGLFQFKEVSDSKRILFRYLSFLCSNEKNIVSRRHSIVVDNLIVTDDCMK